MTVLIADCFNGPYTIVNSIYKPLDMDSYGFCLHVDGRHISGLNGHILN